MTLQLFCSKVSKQVFKTKLTTTSRDPVNLISIIREWARLSNYFDSTTVNNVVARSKYYNNTICSVVVVIIVLCLNNEISYGIILVYCYKALIDFKLFPKSRYYNFPFNLQGNAFFNCCCDYELRASARLFDQ